MSQCWTGLGAFAGTRHPLFFGGPPTLASLGPAGQGCAGHAEVAHRGSAEDVAQGQGLPGQRQEGRVGGAHHQQAGAVMPPLPSLQAAAGDMQALPCQMKPSALAVVCPACMPAQLYICKLTCAKLSSLCRSTNCVRAYTTSSKLVALQCRNSRIRLGRMTDQLAGALPGV